MSSPLSPNVKAVQPMLNVRDIKGSLDFYIRGLPFELQEAWTPKGEIEWCRLQLGNASLMIQQSEAPMPEKSEQVGIQLYFICEDALAIYQGALINRLEVSEPFVGNGMWVVALTDPDGNEIFFESTTEAPEETRYTDWMREKQR